MNTPNNKGATKNTEKALYEQEFKKRRSGNLIFLAILVFFILSLMLTAVVVRLNHIKGLTE